jgi:hypothetical protein
VTAEAYRNDRVGCGANCWAKQKTHCFSVRSLSGEHAIPYCRRSGLFEVAADIKLTFVNMMHQLNAGNDDGGIPEPFEPEHDVDPGLDVPMVPLDQVVQVLRGSKLRVARQQAIVLHLMHRAMRGGITVQGNRVRSTALTFDRFLEEGLGCRHVSPDAEPEIDGLACSIYHPVQITPLASDVHISLVDPSGWARRDGKAIPALDKLASIPLYPSQNRRVGQRQAPLGHHLDQVAQAELEAQVPSHAQNDDFAIKVATCEQLLHTFAPAHTVPQFAERSSLPDQQQLFAPEPLVQQSKTLTSQLSPLTS